MLKSSYRIATVFGIPIKAHTTLIILFLWVMSDYGLVNGFILTLGLLFSISLHELGHSLIAIKKGCRVREITLMAIGGAAQMERMPRKPFDEFLMALAGPLVSFLLGAFFILAGLNLPIPVMHAHDLNLVVVLGFINIGLAVFNLVPSFPMDGGRILRAAMTPRFGRLRATYIASRIGKIICIIVGIVAFMHREWFLLAITFFIYNAAEQEYRMVKRQEMVSAAWGSAGEPEYDSTGNQPDEAAEDDRVFISPPPYKKGPGSTAEIHNSDEDNPFTNLFKL